MTIIARFYKKKNAQTPKFKAGDVVYLASGTGAYWPAGATVTVIGSGPSSNAQQASLVYTVQNSKGGRAFFLDDDITDQAPKFAVGDTVDLLNASGQKGIYGQAQVVTVNGYQKKEWFYNVQHQNSVMAFPESGMQFVSNKNQPNTQPSHLQSTKAWPKYKNGQTVYQTRDIQWPAGTQLKIVNSTGWVRNPAKDVSYEVEFPATTPPQQHAHVLEEDMTDQAPKFKIGDKVKIGQAEAEIDGYFAYEEAGSSSLGGWTYDVKFTSGQYTGHYGNNVDDRNMTLINQGQSKPMAKFKVGDYVTIHPLEIPENGTITHILPPQLGPGDCFWYEVETDSGSTETIDEESVVLLPRGKAQPSQPSQQAPTQTPSKQAPFQQRMNDVLRRLQVSPTDKQTKKEYEQLLIEQQEEEMKNVVAKLKRKKK